MAETPLITKYRPADFSEVIGNETVINALASAINSPSRPHAYLFTGPSGLGKTTLARIVANKVGSLPVEIDAASHSGVDDMKGIVEMNGYKPLDGKSRTLIVDECHAISKVGWQPLLKLLEDPPDFLYITLCTTESQKVPDNIKTRCYPVVLKNLKPREIEDLLETVSSLEGWKVADDTFQAIVQASSGSARKALTILQVGHDAPTRTELSKLISQVELDSSPGVELCKLLMSNVKNWKRISQLLNEIEDDEEAIMVITRYLTAAMIRSEEVQAQNIWYILQAFTLSQSWDKRVQLVVAVGRAIWGATPF